jgi:putative DNA-invertase from lambdoid prophage Rac
MSIAALQRRGFTRLLDRLEPGDVLVITKLDRLRRSAMDVSSTVTRISGPRKSMARLSSTVT